MKKSILIFITYLLFSNVIFGNRTEDKKLYYKYYYYPAYRLYYETNSGKWYYKNGCTWVITKSFPKNYSFIKVKLSKKQIIYYTQNSPFLYTTCTIPQKMPKPKYRKIYFKANTTWKSEKGSMKFKSKTVYNPSKY